MSSTVFDRLVELITQRGVTHQVSRHEPVYTSEEAARVRGTPLASGAKALICKGDNDVINFNAGDHSVSVSMRYVDYVQIEKPGLGIFGVESEP